VFGQLDSKRELQKDLDWLLSAPDEFASCIFDLTKKSLEKLVPKTITLGEMVKTHATGTLFELHETGEGYSFLGFTGEGIAVRQFGTELVSEFSPDTIVTRIF
jgi:hypothetical protein